MRLRRAFDEHRPVSSWRPSPYVGFYVGLHCCGAIVLALFFLVVSLLGCEEGCDGGGGWRQDPNAGEWRLMTWSAIAFLISALVFGALVAAGARVLAAVVHAVELGALALLLWLAVTGGGRGPSSRTEWGFGLVIAAGEALALLSFVHADADAGPAQ